MSGKYAEGILQIFKSEKIQKELKFSVADYDFSFRPFSVFSGLLLVFVFLALITLSENLFFPQNQLKKSAIISSVIIKQAASAKVNEPVQWVALVKRSQINRDQYFAKLPKEAGNISVKSITAKEAGKILAKQPLPPENRLGPDLDNLYRPAGNSAQENPLPKSQNQLTAIFQNIKRFFLTDLIGVAEDSLTQEKEELPQLDRQPEYYKDKIKENKEGVFIDLSQVDKMLKPDKELPEPNVALNETENEPIPDELGSLVPDKAISNDKV
ncbi:MAG: hypothetical protein AAB877_00250, partial [Patescibacteria group bacterium]